LVIISKTVINDFATKHADSIEALNRWYFQTKLAEWKKLADIKADFPSVDYVGNDRYVFNIKGNDYRLVAMIFFNVRSVYIRFIGTHSEYDRTDVTSV
jgi:mRNA interferase HigB